MPSKIKQANVKIGDTYIAKISDKLTVIRITEANSRKGWHAINLATGREVRILSAAKLRLAVRSCAAPLGTTYPGINGRWEEIPEPRLLAKRYTQLALAHVELQTAREQKEDERAGKLEELIAACRKSISNGRLNQSEFNQIIVERPIQLVPTTLLPRPGRLSREEVWTTANTLLAQ